jgi:salicylate hydroxylase
MTSEVLIAGGGLGGLAAAVAARRAGCEARVFEQAASFSEVGAGIQLGPNATRILREWDLLRGALLEGACLPQRLRVRDALDGRELGSLALGEAMEARYGAPYLSIHRADLHSALLRAAQDAGAWLHTGRRVAQAAQQDDGVRARTEDGVEVEADVLVAADGLWSSLLPRPAPERTGHLAYRSLARQQDLPVALRSTEVTVWLGPHMHMVTYPVQGGDGLNAVCIVEGEVAGDPRDWDHTAAANDLERSVGPVFHEVLDRLRAMPSWRLWVLHDRPPVRNADALAQGRIALLGDAAHPMRPYLAQGAGMALEDARELQRVLHLLKDNVADVPTALRRYALNRWQRVARVQARSRRNGVVFHAAGPLRAGRNIAMRALGEKLLDQPWLYQA